MRRTKRPVLFWAGLALFLLLSGCGSGKREKVTVALWSDQLTERYGTYLQNRFPEVEFEFYVATNSTDFYRFKQKSGDLPDILTVRRFSLQDVEDWRGALLDLSSTELANTFHQSYLRSYTYEDGTVNWLPACGEVDCILVNTALLAEHHIPIPTSYAEFTDACAALKALGIRPFASNFAADYTCMEVLQGLSAPCLTSQTGREWRQRYESGQTRQLSEEVWLPIFQRMEEFIGHTGITAADLKGNTADLFTAYRNHEVAMIRGTCGEANHYGVEAETQILPYFGDSPEDSWYLTYPAFQAAISARAAENPARRELLLDILEAMLDQEGLRHIATGQDMIAYTKGVELPLSSMLDNMPPYLDSNHLYIRLASSEMFSISQQVVQGMISGEYPNARAAFDAFNRAMQAEEEALPAAARLDAGYTYAFRPDGGSQAASAVMNTVREAIGTQFLIGPAASVAGNIAAGDYTLAELQFLTMGESPGILLCDMTGEQLYRYVDYVLTTPGRPGSVINDSTLYVSSGFEMTVKKTDEGYALEQLSAGGKELDPMQTYSVALLGNVEMLLQDALTVAGVTHFTESDAVYQQIVAAHLANGGQLAEPTAYITRK
ncbi:MAG: hypothetical protein K2P20_04740 [Oscillospiraceae bacterium]|nr:hypothetical protein [Oscillospiraceae bacterium]